MGKVKDLVDSAVTHGIRFWRNVRKGFIVSSPVPERHVAVRSGYMAQLRERPEWQADKDAPICTRCKAEFTFFFRKAIREKGPKKKLTVKVYEAANLLPGAKPRNPYFLIDLAAKMPVQVRVQEFEEKSKVVPETLSPKWDERMVFEKLLTLTSAIGVEIEFWDKDRWKKDEYLGGALITLDRSNGVVQDGVLTAAFVEGWHPLRPRQNREENVRGEVHVKLQYH